MTEATDTPPQIDPTLFDPDAVKVLTRLTSHGHQAYFVGGCVRDLLVGRNPKDFDIATSAHPGEVRAIFRNCRLIGRRFRLAHVYFKGGKVIEVSTFRANPAEIEDLPPAENGETNVAEPAEEAPEEDLLITQDNVFGTAEQDARRRDFTINGLFYDYEAGRVIDYVRGLADLHERNMRTIGDPERRLREDPVRILRAVRFACKLEFDIESSTYAAMEGTVEDLPRCAPPRLLEETFRLIRGGNASECLKLLAALDALRILMPPVAEFLSKQPGGQEGQFYAFTEALDRRVRAGQEVEDAVLLAAILLPIALAAPLEEGDGPQSGKVARAIEDLLSNLVQTARLPRRIAERCRLVLSAQRILSGQRRRRTPLAGFRRHPLFREAMALFEIWVDATGEHREALVKWQAGEAPEVLPDAEGPRRKRRRRRHRPSPVPLAGSQGEGGAPVTPNR